MTKTNFIISNFDRLLEVLDARACVDVFVQKDDGSNYSLKSGKVYEILADDVFKKYARSIVIGLSMSLHSVQILISEV